MAVFPWSSCTRRMLSRAGQKLHCGRTPLLQSRESVPAQVRMRTDALSRAFSQRSGERATSHTAHKLAMGTFALAAALESGRPFAAPLGALRGSAPDDPLVQAALSAISDADASTARALRHAPCKLMPLLLCAW